MIPSSVFARYARSLADVVTERHEESEVSRDLSLYREIFQAVPQLLECFDNPAVPREAKDKVLLELMALYPLVPTAANFLRILLDHSRIRYFNEILDLFNSTLNERKGIVAAQVTSAATLSSSETAALREGLSRAVGKTVNLNLRTDAELLGGVVVQVGSTVYDGSVRRQLENLRRQLSEPDSNL